MTESTLHIGSLVAKHFRNELTSSEAEELERYFASVPKARLMFEDVNNGTYVSQTIKHWYNRDYSALTAKIAAEVPAFTENIAEVSDSESTAVGEPHGSPVSRGVHFLKTAWFRWAAAIIILFGIGTYIFSLTSDPGKDLTVNPPSPSNDILPGYHRATLTLSDGKKIRLDSAASEIITDQTLSIKNSSGALIYPSDPHNTIDGPLNTMTTPRGGQYQLTLSDGTRVWLNAASSITYPAVFTGTTREVSITGEVYFEVKKNPSQPFVVKTPSEDIVVLGTSFNVNAYRDEAGVKTSLLEGSVKIGDTNIKPGQAYQNGKVMNTNLRQDVAWKNGYFDFENMSVAGALRQLARWYNVEIVTKAPLPTERLKGKMGRDLTLSQVLVTLEEIGIKTKLNGNILVILPE